MPGHGNCWRTSLLPHPSRPLFVVYACGVPVSNFYDGEAEVLLLKSGSGPLEMSPDGDDLDRSHDDDAVAAGA